MIVGKLLLLALWATLGLNWIALQLSPEFAYITLHYIGLVLIAAHIFEFFYFFPKIWATDKPLKNGVMVLIFGVLQVMGLKQKSSAGQ
ncbi:hypothetical protein SIN8267_02022 [Sinobacterium norvegicum]|uniref:DUF1145 domain-containing protein n=1 Tax=Sinobacterium norvegicum TaxID=1641715 RepID=A0ABN8EHS1_9GAMM|nr:hypothetical protein [Sinobacterium norvegicum]CAH0991907.1 hypothetical protein SIN8267_02022 [Sinobacterium norvegicum]